MSSILLISSFLFFQLHNFPYLPQWFTLFISFPSWVAVYLSCFFHHLIFPLLDFLKRLHYHNYLQYLFFFHFYNIIFFSFHPFLICLALSPPLLCNLSLLSQVYATTSHFCLIVSSSLTMNYFPVIIIHSLLQYNECFNFFNLLTGFFFMPTALLFQLPLFHSILWVSQV